MKRTSNLTLVARAALAASGRRTLGASGGFGGVLLRAARLQGLAVVASALYACGDADTAPQPDATPPTTVTGLAFQLLSATSAKISWTAATDPVVAGSTTSGVSSYVLLRCEGSGCLPNSAVSSTAATEATLDGLVPGTTYRIALVAQDGAANRSAPSEPLTLNVPLRADTTPPAAATNLALAAVGSSSARLTWSPPNDPSVQGAVTSGVVGYQVLRCEGLNCTPTASSANVSAAEVQWTELSPGVSYRAAVVAIDGAGNRSTASSIVSFTTSLLPDVTPPAMVAAVSAQPTGPRSAQISWNASVDATLAGSLTSGVTSYQVLRCEGDACTPIAVVANSGTTQVSLDELNPGSTYRFRVVAVDAAGNRSDPSQTTTLAMPLLPDTTAPLAAANVVAIAAGPAAIKVTWSAAVDATVPGAITSGVSSYVVKRCAGVGCTPTASSGTTTGTELTAAGLTAGTVYRFTVVAVDAAGNASASSQVAQVTLPSDVPNQPSRVIVSGRQLLVQRRNVDGTLGPSTPYVMHGMNWSPASRTTQTSPTDPNNVIVRRPEFGRWYLTDIPLLRQMNVNTVRLFMDPGLPGDPNLTVDGNLILDEFYRNGIMVIITVDNANNSTERIQPVVARYRNHPAVLAWSIGSEWSINRFFKPAQFPTVESAALAVEAAAQAIKAVDTSHPVVSSYGNIDSKPDDIDRYVNQLCPSVDVWSFNLYRGPGFSRFFDQWRAISTKPAYLGEYGIDAYNSTTQQEDQATQAQWIGGLADDIARNLSARNPSNAVLGGFVMAFNDEWWKTGDWRTQDPFGWNPIAFPDRAASEDWWGVVTIDRAPRQVYYTLAEKFSPGYVPPAAPATVVYRAESLHPNAIRFWENASILYQADAATAADSGGRGFNVVALNRATGELIAPVQRFDTWASRTSGANHQALVNFLDAVPAGTLLLLSVGDEAGLNNFDSCSQLPHPWTQSLLARLSGLGSTLINGYCYRDQWSMITIKGQGVLREAIGRNTPGTDAVSEASLQR